MKIFATVEMILKVLQVFMKTAPKVISVVFAGFNVLLAWELPGGLSFS